MVPIVSVILPTYNRARLLPRAIASVLGQSWRDLELIVVDDGSSDDTAAVVRGFDDTRIVYLPPERNLGDAGARVRGIASARGEWLAFQDSDDEWLPGRLELQMAYAASLGPDFALVGGTVLRYVGGPLLLVTWPLGERGAQRGEVDHVEFIHSFCAFLQSVLVRRSAYEEIGGFDTRLKASSDFEFCLRLAERFRMAAVMEPVALSYETPEGLSLRADYRFAAMDYILSKHGENLQRIPKALAQYYYLYAKAAFELNENRIGRSLALKAVRLNPGRAYYWALLGAGLLGGGFTTRLIRANQNQRLKGSFARDPA